MQFKNKKIICFGSGSYFKVMYYDMKSRYLDFHVEAVIDNNPDKAGKVMKIAGDNIPIVALDYVVENYQRKNIVLMITTTFYQLVMKQLHEIEFFRDVEIYSYYEKKRLETPIYEVLNTTASKALIPKKIHYCWFGEKELPEHLRKNVDYWKRICPDYEFICWNEKNYDLNKNQYLHNYFEQKKWSYLPDYIRLDVIYEHGGIYLDTDVELVQPLDTLLCNQAFFCTEIAGGVNEGSGFGAVKGFPLVKELMDAYKDVDLSNPLAITASSGMEIEVFHRNGFVNNGRFQIVGHAAIYPYQVMTAMIRETGECMRTAATVGIHHFEGSWC